MVIIVCKGFFERYFIEYQQIEQHLVHFSECLYQEVPFYATQIIKPYLTSRISANHDKGILRGIRIWRLAKTSTLYYDWLRSLRVNYLSCLKRKGGLKTFIIINMYYIKCCAICFSIIKSFLLKEKKKREN